MSGPQIDGPKTVKNKPSRGVAESALLRLPYIYITFCWGGCQIGSTIGWNISYRE